MTWVDVWLSAPLPPADVAGLLTPDEARVLDGRSRRAADRDRSATGRALLRAGVARHAGVPPTDVLVAARCRTCGAEDHGKPYVVGLAVQVSLSHAGSVVVVAIADAPVGVDVEHLDGVRFDGFAEVVLHPAEQSRLCSAGAGAVDPASAAAMWVRKEALLKVGGAGLARDPRTVDLGPRAGRNDVVDDQDGPVGLADLDLTAFAGYHGAVALAGRTVPGVRLRAVASPWDVAAPGVRTPRP